MPDKISWRSLINIKTNHSPETAAGDAQQISAVLDKVEGTELGQSWLANLSDRLHGQKLDVTTARYMDSSKNIFGSVNINFNELSAARYQGQDGNYYPLTVEQAVIHEIFGHKAVGSAGNKRYDEQQAVDITNDIQSAIGSQEEPRGDYRVTCIEPGMLLAAFGPYQIQNVHPDEVTYCAGPRPPNAKPISKPSTNPGVKR